MDKQNNNKSGMNSDFFLNFKLPTHLPNEKPPILMDVVPSSLPSKPPVSSLPPVPRTKNIKGGKRNINKVQNEVKVETPFSAAVTEAAKSTNIEEEDEDEEEHLDEKVPIPIPGTSIILNTDEDILKWIEERKKNWPSKKRMEEKQRLGAQQKRKFGDLSNGDDLDSTNGSNSSSKRQKRYCKFFIRGNCRNENCANLHEMPVRPLPNHKLVYHHDVPINIPERYSKSLNLGKSLHNLVVEHDFFNHENSKILDIIDKLVQKNYITANYEAYKK